MPETAFLPSMTPADDPEKYDRLRFLRFLTIPRWEGEVIVTDYPHLDVGHETESGRVSRNGDWRKASEAGQLVLASLEIMFAEREPDAQHFNGYAA